jgi:hypothetical protein
VLAAMTWRSMRMASLCGTLRHVIVIAVVVIVVVVIDQVVPDGGFQVVVMRILAGMVVLRMGDRQTLHCDASRKAFTTHHECKLSISYECVLHIS